MITVFYTTLALLAFAANSILCRLALGSDAIDANSFTIIRLFSGALTLSILVLLSSTTEPSANLKTSNRWAPLMLFVYASAFSFAYLQLDAGIGALILFGCVQITMVLAGLFLGERLTIRQTLGLIIACLGLTYLMWPTDTNAETSISILGCCLMSLSGIAWGFYTLLGKQASDPLQNTASNFLRSLPYTLILFGLFFFRPVNLSFEGVLLALISGALTSGIGYALWYRALPYLSRMQASVLQLSVPILAVLGGVMFLNELFTTKLGISLMMVSIGIFLVTLVRHKSPTI